MYSLHFCLLKTVYISEQAFYSCIATTGPQFGHLQNWPYPRITYQSREGNAHIINCPLADMGEQNRTVGKWRLLRMRASWWPPSLLYSTWYITKWVRLARKGAPTRTGELQRMLFHCLEASILPWISYWSQKAATFFFEDCLTVNIVCFESHLSAKKIGKNLVKMCPQFRM